jgi:hypothetical protein
VIRKCWDLTVLKRSLQSAIGGWNLFAFAIACRRTTLRPAWHLRHALPLRTGRTTLHAFHSRTRAILQASGYRRPRSRIAHGGRMAAPASDLPSCRPRSRPGGQRLYDRRLRVQGMGGRALGRVPNGVPESPSISAGERRPYVAVSTFIYFATSATLGGYC